MSAHPKTIAAIIARCRRKAGLTQLQLGRRLGYRNAQFVSNWERGLSAPPLDKLKEITVALDMDPHKLMLNMVAIYRRKIAEVLFGPGSIERNS